MRKLLMMGIVALIFCAPTILLAQAPPTPAPAVMTPELWRADLHSLATEMARVHKNMFHSVTREEFDRAVRRVDEQIPSLTRNQILVEFSRLVAMVGDGHTSIALFTDPKLNFHAFP